MPRGISKTRKIVDKPTVHIVTDARLTERVRLRGIMSDIDWKCCDDNSEPETLSAKEDENIVDEGMTVPEIPEFPTGHQLARFNLQPLFSSQLHGIISDLTRIQAPSLQLRGIISDLTRIQAPSLQLRGIISDLTRIQAPSLQLRGIISDLTRIQAPSLQLRGIISDLTRIQAPSLQLRGIISDLTRIQAPSLQLRDAMSVFSTFPYLAVSSQFSTINIAPKANRKSSIYLDKSRVRSGSEPWEAKDTAVASEKQFWLEQFDGFITDTGLIRVCRGLFRDGHYAVAVEKAQVHLENVVRQKSGLADKYGADLMRTAFSPSRPILQLNKQMSLSDKDEQQGYMHIYEGVMMGIRNPRAHDCEREDSPQDALALLVMANYLIGRVNAAIKQ